MSKTFERSLASSSSSRSSSSVARPASCRTCATYWLRGLNRPLPLPCAKTTTAPAPRGRRKVPRMVRPPAAIATSCSSTFEAPGPFMRGPPGDGRMVSRRRLSCPAAAHRAGEELGDLVILGLGEVLVPEPDGPEGLGRDGADAFVGDVLELGAGGRGADRHGDDDPRGPLAAQCLHGGAHGRTGGQAVVDEDHDPAADVHRRAVVAVGDLAPGQLETLAVDRVEDLVGLHVHDLDHLVVHHDDAARRDRAHGQLLVAGCAELAHEEDVERVRAAPGRPRTRPARRPGAGPARSRRTGRHSRPASRPAPARLPPDPGMASAWPLLALLARPGRVGSDPIRSRSTRLRPGPPTKNAPPVHSSHDAARGGCHSRRSRRPILRAAMISRLIRPGCGRQGPCPVTTFAACALGTSAATLRFLRFGMLGVEMLPEVFVAEPVALADLLMSLIQDIPQSPGWLMISLSTSSSSWI